MSKRRKTLKTRKKRKKNREQHRKQDKKDKQETKNQKRTPKEKKKGVIEMSWIFSVWVGGVVGNVPRESGQGTGNRVVRLDVRRQDIVYISTVTNREDSHMRSVV